MSGFSLKVVEGGLKGEEFILEQQGLCLIGRDEACSISIPREKDVGVSRRHSLIIIDSYSIRIRDLYSTNGTYVNGHRLLPAPVGESPESENPNDHLLQEGDVIALSNIVMELHFLTGIETTNETTKQKFQEPLHTSQTTKTKLIEFSKGKTRSNSLIPETNAIENVKIEGSSNSQIEETQLFASLPVTEPIARPSWAIVGKDKKSESPQKINEKKSSDNNEIPKEKPDKSIIKRDNITNPQSPVSQTIYEDSTTEDSFANKTDPVPDPIQDTLSKSSTEQESNPTSPDMSSSSEEPPELSLMPDQDMNNEGDPPVPTEKPKEIPKGKLVGKKSIPHLLKRKYPSEEKKIEIESGRSANSVQPVEDIDDNKDSVLPENPKPVKEKTETVDKVISNRRMLFDSKKMKALEEFAGNLAHDYNKQLSVVMGYAELLKNSKDPSEIEEYADSIFRAAQLSSELTQQLLLFASHDHDTGTSMVNLSEMLTEIVSVMKHTAKRNISIEYANHSESKGLYTIGNQFEIYEALLNIAFNSIDSISGTGKISFHINPVKLTSEDISKIDFDLEPGDFVKITVKDTGSGIKDEDFKQIFEPFFTTKKKGQALGMGLAVSYGVVKNHNGAVDVLSEPGKGTVFDVFLPLVEKSNFKMGNEK